MYSLIDKYSVIINQMNSIFLEIECCSHLPMNQKKYIYTIFFRLKKIQENCNYILYKLSKKKNLFQEFFEEIIYNLQLKIYNFEINNIKKKYKIIMFSN